MRIDLNHLTSIGYSAVFSDACDAVGLRNQTLGPAILHLAGPRKFLIGWARTALSLPVADIPSSPYAAEIAYLDSLAQDDVAIVDCSYAPAAAWGELFSAAASARGARGAVINGLIRDGKKIDALGGFPVFGTGNRPTDSLGRVSIKETDQPLLIDGVAIRTGDLVAADSDGVVIVPRASAEAVVEKVLKKASDENKALLDLKGGSLLREVWDRHRVL